MRTADTRKLTQKDVAQFLGVDRSTYNKYETGDSEPTFDTICRLADFFDVSVEYLMGRSPIKKAPTSEEVNALTPKQREIIDMMERMTSQQQDELLRQAQYQLWLAQQDRSDS